MGSQTSKIITDQSLPSDYLPLNGCSKIYTNILNGYLLQKHDVWLANQSEAEYERDVFVFRKMNADFVLSANYFQNAFPQSICSMPCTISFYTQHPSSNFCSNYKTTEQKAFSHLITALKGFSLLHDKFGPFKVGFQHLFLTVHSQLKVWISSDLGKTKVQNVIKTEFSTTQMIQDIFNIFDSLKNEKNTQNQFSKHLQNLMRSTNKNFTFQQAIDCLICQSFSILNKKSKFMKPFIPRVLNKKSSLAKFLAPTKINEENPDYFFNPSETASNNHQKETYSSTFMSQYPHKRNDKENRQNRQSNLICQHEIVNIKIRRDFQNRLINSHIQGGKHKNCDSKQSHFGISGTQKNIYRQANNENKIQSNNNNNCLNNKNTVNVKKQTLIDRMVMSSKQSKIVNCQLGVVKQMSRNHLAMDSSFEMGLINLDL